MHMNRTPLSAVSLLALALTGQTALAQRQAPSVREIGPSASPQPSVRRAGAPSDATPRGRAMAAGQRPVVLLTGYWPPTNEMLRRFSPKPSLNPQGWIGSDWHGRGYDVMAFFPEFPNPNCGTCGTGFGDLTVDYQDTVPDFARISELLRPIAVITFSRGFPGTSWEVEMNQFNRSSWIDDYVVPRQPDTLPPDGSLPAGALRLSSLPANRIIDAVEAANVGVDPRICWAGDGGGFLSEFVAYLGVWYQARNADPLSPDWCVSAGHVHVGGAVSWTQGAAAAEVTLETVLDHVDEVLACPPVIQYCEGLTNSLGAGADLSVVGAPSISGIEMRLHVQRLPLSAATLTFYGPDRGMGTIGDGLLCVGGSLTRLVAINANSRGARRILLDLTAPPLGSGTTAVTVGSTWRFQTWYRDSIGAGSNTTNAIEITFCP